MSELLDLPTETLLNICRQSPLSSLKALRLSCKTLENVATEFITIRAITLDYTKASIEGLKCISQHPRFRNTITGLWFNADRLTSYPTRSIWERMAITLQDCHGEDATGVKKATARPQASKFEAEELNHAYTEYQRMLDEQRDIRNSLLDFREIPLAISRLTALDDILFTLNVDPVEEMHYPAFSREWGKPYKSTLVLPDCRQYCSGRYQPLGCHQFTVIVMALMGLDERYITSNQHRPGRHSASQIDEYRTAPSVSELHVDAISWSWFRFVNMETQLRLCSAFARLERLVLIFQITDYRDDRHVKTEAYRCRRQMESGGLKALLSAAPLLWWLTLRFCSFNADKPEPGAAFTHVVGDMTWPQLKHLELEGFLATSDELLGLLRHYGPRLRTLSLRSLWLTDYSNESQRELNTALADFDDRETFMDPPWERVCFQDGREVDKYKAEGSEYAPSSWDMWDVELPESEMKPEDIEDWGGDFLKI